MVTIAAMAYSLFTFSAETKFASCSTFILLASTFFADSLFTVFLFCRLTGDLRLPAALKSSKSISLLRLKFFDACRTIASTWSLAF